MFGSQIIFSQIIFSKMVMLKNGDLVYLYSDNVEEGTIDYCKIDEEPHFSDSLYLYTCDRKDVDFLDSDHVW